MHLTELQKSIVESIRDRRITDVISFFNNFCEFRTQGVRTLLYDVDEKYLSLNADDNYVKCEEFASLVRKLHENGLIELTSGTSQKTFLVFQSEDQSNIPAQIDWKIFSILNNLIRQDNLVFRISTEIIPLPELSEFIRRGYRTISEYRDDEKAKSDEKSQRKSLIISIIALVVTIISSCYLFYRDTVQDQRVEQLEYKNDSMNYRPRLEIVGKPSIKAINIKADSVKPSGEFLDAYSKLSFTAELKFKNTGNSTGRIIAQIEADTVSGYDNIRTMLLSYRRNEAKFISEPWKEFFLLKEVLPTDTTILEVHHEFDFVSNSQAVLHLLILYENELNNLYDTYYWARFKVNTMIIGSMKHTLVDSVKMLIETDITFAKKDLQNAIVFQDGNQSLYPYKMQERKDILKFLKARMKK